MPLTTLFFENLIWVKIINVKLLPCFLLFLIEFILLASFYYCNMAENINIKTVKDLKAYLDDKIDKLTSS